MQHPAAFFLPLIYVPSNPSQITSFSHWSLSGFLCILSHVISLLAVRKKLRILSTEAQFIKWSAKGNVHLINWSVEERVGGKQICRLITWGKKCKILWCIDDKKIINSARKKKNEIYQLVMKNKIKEK